MQISSLASSFAAQCIKMLALVCKKNLYVERILRREPDLSFH